MDKFFEVLKKLRPGVQQGKITRDRAKDILMQESGVSEQLASKAADNMLSTNPEVQGGVFTLVPKDKLRPAKLEVEDPSVEERTGGLLKEGRDYKIGEDGEYISLRDQESDLAKLGDKESFEYEMALYRQRRKQKMEKVYKQFGAVTEKDKALVDEYVDMDSEGNFIFSPSNPKYDKSTASIFIQESLEDIAGADDLARNILYGRVAENIYADEGLEAYINYVSKELKKQGLSFNEQLLKRLLNRDKLAGGGRAGFKEGTGRKGILSALVNKLNEIAPGSTAVGKTTKAMSEAAKRKRAEEDLFKDFSKRNPDPKRQLTDDEIREYEEELGDSETWMSEGTVEEAERALKRQKEYEAAMYTDYKAGRLDPKPGEKGRKEFLEKKMEEMEMSGDKKLMTRDEIEELSTFDLGEELDQLRGMSPKMAERFELQKKYPGLDDDLITAIVDDADPNNKAQVLATLDTLMELQKQGKTPEEAVDIIKKTMFIGRKDNAKGGLNYLMGL